MYVPRHFAETDQDALRRLMRENDFALMVAVQDGRPEAAHLPVLLDESRGTHGTLLVHVARANPLWRAFDGKQEVLTVFQGPHAYISPNWYASPASVPTWNYAAVHAYGTPRIVSDNAGALAILERLVAHNERGEKPWRMADWKELVDKMLPGIVAFEIPVARLEGKWKLSQNKTEADRRSVIDILGASPDPGARGVAALMAARERS
jgi:transcriptional regulator